VNAFGGNQEKRKNFNVVRSHHGMEKFSNGRGFEEGVRKICRRFCSRTASDDMYHITTLSCQQPGMFDEAQAQFNAALNHSC